jgi:hypothetical protein
MRLAGHKLPHFLILTALAYGHAVLASAQQQTATQKAERHLFTRGSRSVPDNWKPSI